jgi:hypothetical protein
MSVRSASESDELAPFGGMSTPVVFAGSVVDRPAKDVRHVGMGSK